MGWVCVYKIIARDWVIFFLYASNCIIYWGTTLQTYGNIVSLQLLRFFFQSQKLPVLFPLLHSLSCKVIEKSCTSLSPEMRYKAHVYFSECIFIAPKVHECFLSIGVFLKVGISEVREERRGEVWLIFSAFGILWSLFMGLIFRLFCTKIEWSLFKFENTILALLEEKFDGVKFWINID